MNIFGQTFKHTRNVGLMGGYGRCYQNQTQEKYWEISVNDFAYFGCVYVIQIALACDSLWSYGLYFIQRIYDLAVVTIESVLFYCNFRSSKLRHLLGQ